MSLHDIGTIILAAGRAERFGGTKLLRPVAGKPMVMHVIDAVREAGMTEIRIVIQPDAEEMRAIAGAAGVTLVIAPDYARGMAHSLAAGIAAAGVRWRGAFIMLGDMPFVAPALVQRMATRLVDGGIVVPTHAGRRGNPVLWSRAHFAKLGTLQGDIGGRALLQDHSAAITEVPWHDDSIFIDIDTPEDYAALHIARDRRGK